MIHVIRSSITLPATRTVIRAGDIIIPVTQPPDLAQRRRWRECRTPTFITPEADA